MSGALIKYMVCMSAISACGFAPLVRWPMLSAFNRGLKILITSVTGFSHTSYPYNYPMNMEEPKVCSHS